MLYVITVLTNMSLKYCVAHNHKNVTTTVTFPCEFNSRRLCALDADCFVLLLVTLLHT